MWNFFRKGCRKTQPELWDFAANRLPEEALERVERHLETCAPCRLETESLRRAQRLLNEARREEPPMPRKGWADLQHRLNQESPLQTLAPLPQASTTFGKTNRWVPSMTMAFACTTMLICGALGYRMVGLQRDLRETQGIIAGLPEQVHPENVTYRNEPETSTKPPVKKVATRNAHSNGTQRSVKSTPAVKRERELVPTPYSETPPLTTTNYKPEASVSKPRPQREGIAFQPRQKSEPARAIPVENNPREYIMGTLTPVAHENESAY